MPQTAVWIVIPAFNEAPTIAEVIADVRCHGWHNIVVVNDGSSDLTATISKQCGAHVISLPKNSGQGAALAAGLAYIRQLPDAGITVTFDADGQHRAADIELLVSALENQSVSVALGSRFLVYPSRVPFWRQLVLQMGAWLTRWLTGLAVTDTHNGLRAMRRDAFTAIDITEPHMAHASQILHQIAQTGLTYTEVPTSIRYPKHHRSQSILYAFPLGVKLFFHKLRP